MLTPSEGKEIYERIMRELGDGHEMTPEDVAALMQAAESGHAPAQNAYANVINNVEGNMLAALPWYCKAAQQGHAEARDTLRELYASESLVRAHVSQYLSVQQLIELRKPRRESNEDEGHDKHSPLALAICVVAFLIAAFCPGAFWMRLLVLLGGGLLAMLAEDYYQRNR